MNKEHPRARVLAVDDEESQRTAIAGMIVLWGYAVETRPTAKRRLENWNPWARTFWSPI
jgi:CheY-like chemotaxis protein